MKKTLPIITLLAMLPMAASAAVISTSASAFPTAGDYASDASSTIDASQFQFATGRDDMGQSFTLGTVGDLAYNFNSITLQIRDRGQTDEPSSGITLSIYDGGSVAAGDLLSSVTFTTATFDTSDANFVTFELTAAESLALGQLNAGSEYTAAFTTSNATHDFRLRRNTLGEYAGGNAFWDERDFDGVADAGSLDFVFQVNATAVPEPSSAALLGLAGLTLLARRRK